MDKAKEVFWNATAPLTDQSGGVVPGTMIKSGQEVVYSKMIRKIMRSESRTWMELIVFSLLTAGTDMGFGAWYGEKASAREMGFMDVLKEAVRPLVSVIFVNYAVRVASMGLHNPIRSFGFRELLIQLAAKDLAVGGNTLLASNIEAAANQIAKLEDLEGRQRNAARVQKIST